VQRSVSGAKRAEMGRNQNIKTMILLSCAAVQLAEVIGRSRPR